jgi:hypothetical protein
MIRPLEAGHNHWLKWHALNHFCGWDTLGSESRPAAE